MPILKDGMESRFVEFARGLSATETVKLEERGNGQPTEFTRAPAGVPGQRSLELDTSSASESVTIELKTADIV